MHEKDVCVRIYRLVQRRIRRKIQRKSDDFQEPKSQELLGGFLSNSVCKVWYMMALKYVNLVEMGSILLEL